MRWALEGLVKLDQTHFCVCTPSVWTQRVTSPRVFSEKIASISFRGSYCIIQQWLAVQKCTIPNPVNAQWHQNRLQSHIITWYHMGTLCCLHFKRQVYILKSTYSTCSNEEQGEAIYAVNGQLFASNLVVISGNMRDYWPLGGAVSSLRLYNYLLKWD